MFSRNDNIDTNAYLAVIDGRKYAIDLEALRDFCLTSDNKDGKKRDSEITESYELDDTNGELLLTQKIIRDVDSERNTQNDMILYDVVKILILKLFETNERISSQDVGFSTALTINTLIEHKILVEIK